jgi:intracellular sulfur oxidation DsrE/DsrF family protein
MLLSGTWATLAVMFTSLAVCAAEPISGPVITEYGPVYKVPPGSYNLVPGKHYKVSMDVSSTADFPGDRNRQLESAARFLNMHAANGIDAGDIEFSVVVHGTAAKDLLNDEAYEARFDDPNPNTELLNALQEAGVKIYLCGQTASHRGYTHDELNSAVTMAVSAMTALVRLQSEGFTLIPF